MAVAIRRATPGDAERTDAIQLAAARAAFASFAGPAVAALAPQAARWRLRIAAGREVWLVTDGGVVAADPRRPYERRGWEPDGRVRERTWLGVALRELRHVPRAAAPR